MNHILFILKMVAKPRVRSPCPIFQQHLHILPQGILALIARQGLLLQPVVQHCLIFKLRNSDSQRKKVYLKNYLSYTFSSYISVRFIIVLLSCAAPHTHRAKCCKCLCCPSRKRMRSYPGIDRS